MQTRPLEVGRRQGGGAVAAGRGGGRLVPRDPRMAYRGVSGFEGEVLLDLHVCNFKQQMTILSASQSRTEIGGNGCVGVFHKGSLFSVSITNTVL